MIHIKYINHHVSDQKNIAVGVAGKELPKMKWSKLLRATLNQSYEQLYNL